MSQLLVVGGLPVLGFSELGTGGTWGGRGRLKMRVCFFVCLLWLVCVCVYVFCLCAVCSMCVCLLWLVCVYVCVYVCKVLVFFVYLIIIIIIFLFFLFF